MVAEIGVERRFRPDAAQLAAQPPLLRHKGGDRRFLGEVAEGLEAALLGIDQVGNPLLMDGIAVARPEAKRPDGALLPGEFLALDEIEEGHQRTRDLRIDDGIGKTRPRTGRAICRYRPCCPNAGGPAGFPVGPPE